MKINGNEIRYELAKLNSKNLAGVGASISTTHLIYQFGLNDFISTLFDDDKNKIGCYSPGLGLPVLGLNELFVKNSETVVVLAWQHSKVMLQRLIDINFRGSVVNLLPYYDRIQLVNLAE